MVGPDGFFGGIARRGHGRQVCASARIRTGSTLVPPAFPAFPGRRCGGQHGWGSSMLHFQTSRFSHWSAVRDGDKQQLSQNKFFRVHQPRVVQYPDTPIHITNVVCDPVGDCYPIYSCFGRRNRAADRALLHNPKNPDSISEMIPVGRARSQSE